VIEEIGTVKSIDGVIARVSIPRKSACEGCTAGTCKPEEQSMEIEAINKAGARTGQKVRVLIHSYDYLKGSTIVYGLPAFSFVLGAILGKEFLSGFFTNTDSDIISAVFGFISFILSFIIVKIWASTFKKKPGSKPVIDEVLNKY
jgi:sigma-E factor negative regulatory protein RseC